MTDHLQILAELQVEVEECRNLALELKAHKTVAMLDKLAADLSRCARSMLARRHRDGSALGASSPRTLH